VGLGAFPWEITKGNLVEKDVPTAKNERRKKNAELRMSLQDSEHLKKSGGGNWNAARRHTQKKRGQGKKTRRGKSQEGRRINNWKKGRELNKRVSTRARKSGPSFEILPEGRVGLGTKIKMIKKCSAICGKME